MPSKKIHKILVANRGEIAVRIISTLKKLSISSVAIYADNDVDSMHCRVADEARPLGSGSLKDTYLNIQKIIDAAIEIAYKSFFKTNKLQFIKKAQSLITLQENLKRNGHLKLHFIADLC